MTKKNEFLCQGQPQAELTIRADITINEVLQHGRHAAPSSSRRRRTPVATAYETSSERSVSGLNMITRSESRMPAHQIADGGFIVGAAKIGLGKRGAVLAKMIDHDVVIISESGTMRGVFTHTHAGLDDDNRNESDERPFSLSG